ncbi:MAG: lipopolysaccharide biosynthesis protein [Syntrophomonadaceae bacterium]|nr:lipopolysaccharide biosynthesis protein [Syntrophomonadaceae bacterium]
MENKNLNQTVGQAARWSTITEIAAKILTPITTMILARLLAPEAFGVVATVTMIVSFADMLANAGFQNYLVQREFRDEKHQSDSTNVAFWTNLGISLCLWVGIAIFSEPIAYLVGNPGLGLVITVACVQLPITAFASIQMSLYRRSFDFKTLFTMRLISVSIPFVVTIPLALVGWGYWSLIIGTICGALANAVILTIKSPWKPSLFYDLKLLKEMFNFSAWSLMEAISIWLTGWIDIFIIGSALSVYFLGLYRTSLTMVSGILGIITAATTPLLFAALSRLQDDERAFNRMFFTMQRVVAYFVLPLGIGIYLYNDVATQLFLGSQWAEASRIVGVWAATSAVMIVLGHYSSEVYRAKGQPRLSFWAQVLHLVFLIPTCVISLRYGFWVLVYARALIRLQLVVVHLVIMKYVVGFPVRTMFTNILKPVVFTVVIGAIGLLLNHISPDFGWRIISIGICMAVYAGLLLAWAQDDVRMITDTFLKRQRIDNTAEIQS